MSMKTFTGSRSRLMGRIMVAFHAGVIGDLEDLARHCISTPRNMERYLHELRPLGLARIVAWKRNYAPGATWRGVWGFGEGLPDTPKPAAMGSFIQSGDITGSLRANRILGWLEGRDATHFEVATALGMSISYASNVLRALHRAGHVHVAAWQRQHIGLPLKRYAPGPGSDASRPPPLSKKAASRNRRRRLIEQYGEAITRRIMTSRSDGGPDTVIVDGRVIYRRGKPRGHRKAKEVLA